MKVMVAGGGTGGHLFPGLAVANALKARRPDLEICFVGTENGIEARVIPPSPYRLFTVPVYGLVGKGLISTLFALTLLPAAWQAARRILSEQRPDLVIGVGGFASAPILFSAGMRGIPRVILEQNAVPGVTNRIFAPQADRVFLAFEAARERFKPNADGNRNQISCPGNPIRAELLTAANAVASAPESDAPHLLIFGGSRGASAINDNLVQAAPRLFERVPGLTVTHQTGTVEATEVRKSYDRMGDDIAARVTVLPFIDDMGAEYARASLVVCRAGATTLAELTALGKPSVLIPYPHAAHDHQTANARALEESGAAVLLPQSSMEIDENELDDGSRLNPLIDTLSGLLTDPARRAAMADAARRLGRPDATEKIADACLELLEPSPTATGET